MLVYPCKFNGLRYGMLHVNQRQQTSSLSSSSLRSTILDYFFSNRINILQINRLDSGTHFPLTIILLFLLFSYLNICNIKMSSVVIASSQQHLWRRVRRLKHSLFSNLHPQKVFLPFFIYYSISYFVKPSHNFFSLSSIIAFQCTLYFLHHQSHYFIILPKLQII